MTKDLWEIPSSDTKLKSYFDERGVRDLFPDGKVVLNKLNDVLDFNVCKEMGCGYRLFYSFYESGSRC